MCEWKEFCEFMDKGDDCDDPDFQNGCEQYWGFSRMDDDRFRREMTGRRDAGKVARKRVAESVKEALLHEFKTEDDHNELNDHDRAFNQGLITAEAIVMTLTNHKNGGNQQ